MATWATLLANVREDLQDTSVDKPRWSDGLLYMYAVDAVRDYSTFFPRRIDRVALAVVSEQSYALPTDFLDCISVESPIGRFLKPRQEVPGKSFVFHSSDKATLYHVDASNLYLNGTNSDEDVLMSYYAVHPCPSSKTDTTFVFTIPDRDEELIRLYIKAQVYSQMRSKTARLDRFDQGSGRRDDNPLLPETEDLMKQYHEKIMERMPVSFINLYRVGRRG